jgi:hypothetical protein
MCVCIVKSTGLGKVIYQTESHAWTGIRYGQHFDMRPYPCPSGYGWHIGHPKYSNDNKSHKIKPKTQKINKKKNRWKKYAKVENEDED